MKFSQEELDAVAKLFDGKRGTRSIAKELGVPRNRIICIYKELGIDNSSVKVPTTEPPTHKSCKTCLQDKLIDNFRYRKQHNGKYYYEPYCKECEAKTGMERSKERYQDKGKEEFLEIYSDPVKKQEWLLKNKQYRQSNKDKLRAYRNTRKEQDRKNLREWEFKKRHEDPAFKIRGIVSSSIRMAIKKRGKSKDGSILKHLPYTIAELKDHLEKQFEPWMNWDNHGKYDLKSWDENDNTTWKWQIDHIIPHSDLPYDSMDHPNFHKCWALDNLRPLSAKQNLEYGTRRIRHKAQNSEIIMHKAA
jgi:hypothetical protein